MSNYGIGPNLFIGISGRSILNYPIFVWSCIGGFRRPKHQNFIQTGNETVQFLERKKIPVMCHVSAALSASSSLKLHSLV